MGATLRNALARLRIPAAVSSALVLPFLLLELVNRPPSMAFPYALFAVLWLLPVAFGWLIDPILRAVRTTTASRMSGINVVTRSVVLMLIAWTWSSILLDQLPCFLGVPNCD